MTSKLKPVFWRGMGKIYFNKTTGEFWESSRRKRKPPEGFEYTGFFVDYRRRSHRRAVKKSYFCPVCKEYHFYVNPNGWMPLYFKMNIEFTEKYGCKAAAKIVIIATSMGGRRSHFTLAEALFNRGLMDRWFDRILGFRFDMRSELVRRLLSEDEASVEAWAIAKTLTGQ